MAAKWCPPDVILVSLYEEFARPFWIWTIQEFNERASKLEATSKLKTEISHCLDLFEPSTLIEAFQLARKIEVLLSCSAKKFPTPLNSSP
ncbi:hypothetical protein J1N35_025918 [Gossypium stocksii]|uniref:Uncharacterized protein n=1 Tax=Gossypium stocksii TaxID=47602 RepID=A0A9D3ZWM7_9ROSI|nr:hypothetical protein J1N35_025918 [Gossypium stocksii]